MKKLILLSWAFFGASIALSAQNNTLRGDLIVTDIIPSKGDTIFGEDDFYINFCIKNIGPANMTDVYIWNNTVWLSQDSVLDNNDYAVSGQTIYSLNSGSSKCEAGRVSSADLFNIANGKSGRYFIIAKADNENKYEEVNESNNTLVRPITITFVERDTKISIDSVWVESYFGNGENMLLGYPETFNMGIKLSNKGTDKSRELRLRAYLCTDTTGSTIVDSLYGDLFNPIWIGPGASYEEVSWFGVYNEVPAGKYYLKIIYNQFMDGSPHHSLDEIAYLPITIIQYSSIDLTAKATSVVYSPRTASSPPKLSITVKQINNGVAVKAHSVGVYLAKEKSRDSREIYYLGYDILPYVDRGDSTSTLLKDMICPKGLFGDYYVILESSVQGQDLNKNLFIWPQPFNFDDKAELSIDSLKADISVSSQGNMITIKVKESNTGNKDAPQHSITYHLSKDGLISSNDILLNKYATMKAIKAGATETNSDFYDLSSSIPLGTYYLIANTNANMGIPESDFANNIKVSQAFKITAPLVDLVVDTCRIEKTVFELGDGIDVYVKVRNTGIANSAGFYVDHTISKDTIVYNNDNDIYLEGKFYPGLNAGESMVIDKHLAINGTLSPGNYFFITEVNHEEFVKETNRSNNITIIPITIGVVTDISSEVLKQQIQIYPNPTTGVVHLSNVSNTNAVAELYNAEGRLVYQAPVVSERLLLDFLTTGIYLLKIKEDGDYIYSDKLVYEK